VTDLNARLDTIESRVTAATSTDAALIEDARIDIPRLVAALRAVLDLAAEVGHPLDIEIRERIAAALETT
jgi:hypothetical protein